VDLSKFLDFTVINTSASLFLLAAACIMDTRRNRPVALGLMPFLLIWGTETALRTAQTLVKPTAPDVSIFMVQLADVCLILEPCAILYFIGLYAREDARMRKEQLVASWAFIIAAVFAAVALAFTIFLPSAVIVSNPGSGYLRPYLFTFPKLAAMSLALVAASSIASKSEKATWIFVGLWISIGYYVLNTAVSIFPWDDTVAATGGEPAAWATAILLALSSFAALWAGASVIKAPWNREFLALAGLVTPIVLLGIGWVLGGDDSAWYRAPGIARIIAAPILVIASFNMPHVEEEAWRPPTRVTRIGISTLMFLAVGPLVLKKLGMIHADMGADAVAFLALTSTLAAALTFGLADRGAPFRDANLLRRSRPATQQTESPLHA